MRLVRFWSSWRQCAVRRAGQADLSVAMVLSRDMRVHQRIINRSVPGGSAAGPNSADAVEPGVCVPETGFFAIVSERNRRGYFFGSYCGGAPSKRPERRQAFAFRLTVPTACSSGCASFCRLYVPGSLDGLLRKTGVRGLRCCKRLTICRSFMETPIR